MVNWTWKIKFHTSVSFASKEVSTVNFSTSDDNCHGCGLPSHFSSKWWCSNATIVVHVMGITIKKWIINLPQIHKPSFPSSADGYSKNVFFWALVWSFSYYHLLILQLLCLFQELTDSVWKHIVEIVAETGAKIHLLFRYVGVSGKQRPTTFWFPFHLFLLTIMQCLSLILTGTRLKGFENSISNKLSMSFTRVDLLGIWAGWGLINLSPYCKLYSSCWTKQ